MDTNYDNIFQRHEDNLSELINRYETLLEKKRILEKVLIDKENEITAFKEKLSATLKEYDNLKLASAFSTNEGEEDGEAKVRVNKIIREIDNCIALLNK